MSNTFPKDSDHARYNELREFFYSGVVMGDHFDKQCELASLTEKFKKAGFDVDPLPW